MPIHFADEKTGEPVKNLQRYLGAFGHAMMLSEDMKEYVHAHPAEMLEGTADHDRRRAGSHLPRAVSEARRLSHLAAVPAPRQVVDGSDYGAGVAAWGDGVNARNATADGRACNGASPGVVVVGGHSQSSSGRQRDRFAEDVSRRPVRPIVFQPQQRLDDAVRADHGDLQRSSRRRRASATSPSRWSPPSSCFRANALAGLARGHRHRRGADRRVAEATLAGLAVGEIKSELARRPTPPLRGAAIADLDRHFARGGQAWMAAPSGQLVTGWPASTCPAIGRSRIRRPRRSGRRVDRPSSTQRFSHRACLRPVATSTRTRSCRPIGGDLRRLGHRDDGIGLAVLPSTAARERKRRLVLFGQQHSAWRAAVGP